MKNYIILASSSPARQKLLERLHLPFLTVSPDIDETPLDHETPEDMVKRLAFEKAQKVAESYPNNLIIASDQVAIINNKIAGKPLTHENAVKQLQAVSGKICRFVNGLCLLNSATGQAQVVMEEFSIHYRNLTDAMIENYLHKEKPYFCAGAIKSEGLAIGLFDKMIGEDPTSLEGLPLIRLTKMLENEGVNIFA